ncbi:uncharacterized protein EV422DRAFT_373686 [Fimicolochytrium jonesii]|uniref:uncharacterized protein n=1 Tax=Fimicolochytrium jonesii TaxID=1396493 RepID=UPI0022FF2F74|nr:uncharacterized protein EV422DRAFT_373686 [Fimicolochytrium jonesii]KAI8815519.1 hypothetical protein EV422DRAFT_373686 [Fimicolochytrium jonesii]
MAREYVDPHEGVLYSGFEKYKWLTIHIIALCVIFLSVSGSLYIVTTTIRKMRSQRTQLRTIEKFPMWISLTDCLFGVFHGTDHIISISRGYLATGAGCRMLGFGTVYAMNLPAFWVTAIAFYLWTAIVRGRYINVGSRDWKLHGVCWGVPFVWGMIPFITNDYGQEPAWCGLPNRLFLFNGAIVLLAMISCSLLYGHLTYFLWTHARKTQEQLGPQNHQQGPSKKQAIALSDMSGNAENTAKPKRNPLGGPSQSTSKINKLVKELPVFVLIYMVQWAPYLIYALLLLAKKEWFELDVIVVTLTNAGGIANAVAYSRFMAKDTPAAPYRPSTTGSPLHTRNTTTEPDTLSAQSALSGPALPAGQVAEAWKEEDVRKRSASDLEA